MITNKISDKNYTHECPCCKYRIKLKPTDSTKRVCPICKKQVNFKKVK